LYYIAAMSSHTPSLKELEARRLALLRQLRRAKPLIEGSLAVVHRKCGTPTCRCHEADEYRHRQVMLCRKEGGRSHSTHIPKDLEGEVREWHEEYRRVKQVLKELSAVSEEIVRGYAGAKKARGKKAELQVVAIDEEGEAGR
jgi:hypothetical protein